MDTHFGLRYQTGRGIGSFFSSSMRGLKPIAKMGLNAGKRLLQSDAMKKIGNVALDLGTDAAKNIAVDLLEGKKFSDTADEQLQTAKKKIASKLKEGSGSRKRKNKKPGGCAKVKNAKYNLLK
jgi:hypothetical protein